MYVKFEKKKIEGKQRISVEKNILIIITKHKSISIDFTMAIVQSSGKCYYYMTFCRQELKLVWFEHIFFRTATDISPSSKTCRFEAFQDFFALILFLAREWRQKEERYICSLTPCWDLNYCYNRRFSEVGFARVEHETPLLNSKNVCCALSVIKEFTIWNKMFLFLLISLNIL